MADADDVRRLALALPYVEEIDCDGFDFRVGGKGFVWSYPERQPGKPPLHIVTHKAGSFMGELAQLSGRPVLVDAVALTDVELGEILRAA